MSALPQKADIIAEAAEVRLGPEADIGFAATKSIVQDRNRWARMSAYLYPYRKPLRNVRAAALI
jgi:hypothetical protein